MAVNRFDRAAEASIINTYVPIDFGELYRIGATQKAAVDQAIEDMGTAIQEFGEFISPSDIDTQNFYNMSIGQMQDLIDQMSSNPDLMKDAGYRAMFYGRLNNLDYAGLSRLKQGAKALQQRQENVAKMIANGTYYRNWDRYQDLSNYNTLQQGVLDELAPLQYRSLLDIAAPYVENMKPTFFQGASPNSGYKLPYTNWMAITPEMRAKELDAHLSDIIATPQGQMHLQEIANMYPDASNEDILDMFMNQLMTVTSYKDIETPVQDTASLQTALTRMRTGADNGTRSLTGRTDELRSQAARQIINKSVNVARVLAEQGLISTADVNKMTPEDSEMVVAQMVSGFKRNGVSPEYMFQISPKEYVQYHNSSTFNLTNKKDETPDSWGDQAVVEIYGYRNGDKVFTDDRKELLQIPLSFITKDLRTPGMFDMSRVLQNIDQEKAGFQVSNGSNSFMYNDGDEYDVANNTVKTFGKLYVTEDALRDAIKRTYPELSTMLISDVGHVMRILEEGFEQSGQTYHRSIHESKDKRINGETTYVFDNFARNVGDVSSQNSRFNFDVAKDRTTGTVVSDNWNTILGSSFAQ